MTADFLNIYSKHTTTDNAQSKPTFTETLRPLPRAPIWRLGRGLLPHSGGIWRIDGIYASKHQQYGIDIGRVTSDVPCSDSSSEERTNPVDVMITMNHPSAILVQMIERMLLRGQVPSALGHLPVKLSIGNVWTERPGWVERTARVIDA